MVCCAGLLCVGTVSEQKGLQQIGVSLGLQVPCTNSAELGAEPQVVK